MINFEISKLRMIYRGALRNPRSAAEYVELPESVTDFHGDIWIYADRIVFVTFIGKIISVIIESRILADTARSLFDAVWVFSPNKRKGSDILREMGRLK